MVQKVFEKIKLPFSAQGDPAANNRMDAVTSQAVKQYFDLLEKTLRDNNLLNSPAQIYNVDEAGMAYEHRPPKVITVKGQKGEMLHFW